VYFEYDLFNKINKINKLQVVLLGSDLMVACVDIDFRACASSPCSNDGICHGQTDNANEFKCECRAGYQGKVCQSKYTNVSIPNGCTSLMVVLVHQGVLAKLNGFIFLMVVQCQD